MDEKLLEEQVEFQKKESGRESPGHVTCMCGVRKQACKGVRTKVPGARTGS